MFTNFRILRSLKFVEQLIAEHSIEVLSEAIADFFISISEINKTSVNLFVHEI